MITCSDKNCKYSDLLAESALGVPSSAVAPFSDNYNLFDFKIFAYRLIEIKCVSPNPEPCTLALPYEDDLLDGRLENLGAIYDTPHTHNVIEASSNCACLKGIGQS